MVNEISYIFNFQEFSWYMIKPKHKFKQNKMGENPKLYAMLTLPKSFLNNKSGH